MPRALSRDEQAILSFARRTGASVPVPQLAEQLGISADAAQQACEYLVSRSLLRASVYAVAVPQVVKPVAQVRQPETVASG